MKPATVADMRRQVMARLCETIKAAQDRGEGDGIAAARAAFPGVPDQLLYDAWAKVDGERVDDWWVQLGEALDRAILDRALSSTVHDGGDK